MKAIVVSPVGGRVPMVGPGRRDMEAEEVAAYLGKLRQLLPDAPPDRKLSKLELIKRVIAYIYELESTLQEQPTSSDEDDELEEQLEEELHQLGQQTAQPGPMELDAAQR